MKGKESNKLFDTLKDIGFPTWWLKLLEKKAKQLYGKSLDQLSKEELSTVVLHSTIIAATYGNPFEREADKLGKLTILAFEKLLWK